MKNDFTEEATKWAAKFAGLNQTTCAAYPDLQDTLIGWFNNAMIAGAQTARQELDGAPAQREPFDLEKARAGKPVKTRNGQKYVFGAYNPEAQECCRVTGWVTRIDGSMIAQSHYTSGSYLGAQESPHDLFMVSESRMVWMNIYPNGMAYYHPTKEDADQLICKDSTLGERIACVPVTYRDGE